MDNLTQIATTLFRYNLSSTYLLTTNNPHTMDNFTSTNDPNTTKTSIDDIYPMCPSTNMPYANLIFMTLYGIVFIIGLMGNTLVIYVVLRFSNMQTVTNMYILNLAIADECFLIGIPFLITTMNVGHWIFGSFICKAFMVSTSITQFTSSIFLLIMSADRYIAICHHISSPRYRTPFVSRIVTGVAYTVSTVIMMPIIVYANVMVNSDGHYTCAILWPETHGQLLPGLFSFTIYSLVLGFIIPLCFIMIFYCMVIKKLHSVAKKSNRPKGKRRSHRKVTKLVLTVITVYILCWLPYWVAQISLISLPNDTCSTRLTLILFLSVGLCGYSNSAINPILYAYLSDNFKKSFLKACTCAAAKDANAQLKIETSAIGMKKTMHDQRPSETYQTVSGGPKTVAEITTIATTTTTITSNLPSSQQPSPSNPSYFNVR